MNDLLLQLVKDNDAIGEIYGDEVNKLIRLKYTESQELAILRKKMAGLDDNNEFEAYSEYAEECKKEVRTKLGV